MLDVEVADKVQPTLTIGQTIEYICDGTTRNDLLVAKSAFSVTVQQPSCKLTLPIEYTTAYQREKERLDMARPKKSAPPMVSQPPAMHPSEMQPPAQQLPGHDAAGNLMLPPNSAGVGAMPTQLPAGIMTMPQTAAVQPPREVTIPQVQGDPDWTNKSIDDMVGTLTDTLRNLVENAVADALEQAPSQREPTCFQCVHIDIEGNQCAKFGMLPPLHVIAAPKGKCNEFVDGSVDVPM